jgi:hypothetical protein
MPAVTASLSRTNGFQNFYCPLCAAPVFAEESGVADEFCEHVKVFVDWVGEAVAADELEHVLDDLDVTDPVALAGLFTEDTVVFELIESAGGGGHDGSTCLVAIGLEDD